MGFDNLLGGIRKKGRRVILPVSDIRSALLEAFSANNLKIMDLGAGTLFWTEFIANNAAGNYELYAVDPVYGESSFDITALNAYGLNFCKDSQKANSIYSADKASGKIFLYGSAEDAFRDCEVFDIAFICDTIHHLNVDVWERIFDILMDSTGVFIIKDINANKQLGNWLNKVHDKVINKEDIVDVYPDEIRKKLLQKGFSVSPVQHIPKLWYPHFLLTANKNR